MIKSFFKVNDFDQVLKICLATEKDADNFLSFIKVIGNEVVMLKLTTQDDKDLNEVNKILKNIVKSAKENEQLRNFVKDAFTKLIVNDSVEGLKDAMKTAPKDV